MQGNLPAIHNAVIARAAARPARAPWRVMLAWCMALAFLLMVATSSAHVHKTTQAAHDCELCSVVADVIGDVPVPPALVHVVEHALYRIDPVATASVALVFPVVLPPSCGPPHALV
jgi:hypothetical protein